MKKYIKQGQLLLLVLAAMAMLVGCMTPRMDGDDSGYRVEIRTVGGMPVENVTVQVFAQGEDSLPLATASTNGAGVATFALEGEGPYIVKLSNLPAGHHAECEYRMTERTLTIALETRLLTGSDRNKISTLGVGDVMFDFDVTLPSGESLNLSQVLAEKKAVVLNFWFANCGYCTLEFPAIRQAYLQHADEIEVIALSPYDSNDTIKNYQGRHSLPFPMARCHASWPRAFGISGYPTTVIVDRYGVICAIHRGAVPEEAVWDNVFAHFTAEDYTQQLFDGLPDVG